MKIEHAHSRLLAVMDALERQPHAYGESDCIMRVGWMAAAQVPEAKRAEILALLDRYHGRYTSMAGALRVLRADGLTPLKLVKRFFAEIAPGEAENGDIGAIRQDGRNWSFGVFDRGHLFVSAPAGTGILPRSAAQKAFRVE